jgi:branched-chain amino acid transport system substrate-binding protein
VVVTAASLVMAAACSGSSNSAANPSVKSSGSGTQKTYVIGLLGDFTGVASATSKSMVSALKAGIGLAGEDGYKIKYVTADTQSTPTGALTGAQKLVTQDHVFAVIAISDLTFGAVPFLAAKGVPVIGAAVDGAEWATHRNMFSTFGFPDYTKVPTTPGKFFSLVGASNVGIVGYGLVPSAAEAAKAAAISSRKAGLKVGYLNANFALGSTNVGPDVLAMKHAGVDALSVLLQQNTGFAMLQGLRQQGVKLKAPLFSAGYGVDLLDAGPASQQVAENAYFSLSYEPVEMHTAATERFQKALKKYANATQTPGLNEYLAYTAVAAFEDGLKAAGDNPSQADFINAMLGITKYTAAGLFGSHSVSFAMKDRGQGYAGADNCLWFTQFQGGAFHLVKGADPVCGTIIPGERVSTG